MNQLKEIIILAAQLASYGRTTNSPEVIKRSEELLKLIKRVAPNWLEEASSD